MKGITLAFLLTISFIASSQTCMVQSEALKGTYEGECKKNKADGKGTAMGEDNYTGEFKNGFPDGKGSYKWKNGDAYVGEWKKGQRDGQGTMHYAEPNSKDSALTGFWKKDKYIGRHEKPYIVHSNSSEISRAEIVYTKESTLNEITITIESLTGGASSLSTINPKILVTDIVILKGQYLHKIDYNDLPKSTISTLKSVEFPFRARFIMGNDQIDIEFFEQGSYSVNIKILR